MSSKTKNSGLGRAIIKDRFKSSQKKHGKSNLHTTELEDGYDWNKINLNSVTEENTLDEFLATAELAGTEFAAEKLNVTLVTGVTCLPTAEELKRTKQIQDEHRKLLKIPRRPHWDANTTAEELDMLERDSFLEWRRSLSHLSEVEGIVMTPYERNLDFWRQLWRVIERSDIIVQIVDARNPLLFRCEDLESYVKEVSEDKINIVLINKADFLSDDQRKVWAEYFDGFKLKVVFWSAARELERVAAESSESTDLEEKETRIFDETKNNPDVLTVDELLALFRYIHLGTKSNNEVVTVGLVGYPNVGKSSTINALLTRKTPLSETQEKEKHYAVPVSATPGRTKHFQTFYLDKFLLLCDCPGLVMPTFVATKAEMITNGILSIDHMTDFVPPVSIICKEVPREVLETLYGIMIPPPKEEEDPHRPPTAHELLSSYALMRGYMSHKGVPDCPRAARYILKDYVTGKLCYCHCPPNTNEEEFGSAPKSLKSRKNKNENVNGGPNEILKSSMPEFRSEVDKAFFVQTSKVVGTRGVQGVVGFTRKEGYVGHHSSDQDSTNPSLSGSQCSIDGKPWKRHNNVNKKEKLRRLHGHLDS